MTIERERRKTETPVELRAEGEGRTVLGYGAVFNSEIVIGSGPHRFRERILPGAFKRATSGDVFSFFNHDESKVLGRTKSGTLRLTEDERGLRYEVDLPDTSAARDLHISMDRGDVDGSSFAFAIPEGGDDWDLTDDVPLRTIREVNLYEVGPVTMPAYPDATAALRSLEGARKAAEDERKDRNREGWMKRKALSDSVRASISEQKFRKIPGVQPEA